MRDSYIYRKAIRRPHYLTFKRRALIALFLLVIVAVAAVALFLDLRQNTKKPDTSKIQMEQISDNMTTFKAPYFKFRDSGKWVLDAKNSTQNKFVYTKFKGLDAVYQMIVYDNQLPIPLLLATSRVLPVRIVNDNSFDIIHVSDPCGKYYGAQDLHKVKIISINEANMLCDPDSSQYNVQLSQITGDYQLHLKRLDGSPVMFVITFHDGNLDPGPQTLLRVAASFQAL